MENNRRILGVDPGTNATGYSVIEINNKEIKCLVMGFIDLKKVKDPYIKLKTIFDEISLIVKKYSPTEAAFESPFYGNNIQSMLKLGRAQGVAIAAALTQNMTITEYAPRKVKIAVTGSGSASKEQVSNILQKILKIDFMPTNLDSTDSLAIALCHYYQSSSVIGSEAKARNTPATKNNWSDFVTKNPQRIVATKDTKTNLTEIKKNNK